MEIHHETNSEVAFETARYLSEIFRSYASLPFLFLSSGGSSLQLLDLLDTEHFGPHSTVAVLDERFSTDPLKNNFAQMQATEFYQKAKERGAQFIETKIRENETIEEAAAGFEKALRTWVAKNHGPIIATVGVGPDTHTSGIMPFPEDPTFFETTFNDENHWVAAYDANDKNPERLRITCTIPFFRMITHPVLFVTGENKRDALDVLAASEGTVHEHPCRIWREISSSVLFTDQKI